MDTEVQHTQLPPSVFKIYTDGIKEYEVEKIVGHCRKSCGYEFRIHWKGYDESENTWLIITLLKNANQLLTVYKRV